MIESELLDFIQGSIRSVWHAELLLRLRRTPERAWTADELRRDMRASDAIVHEGLRVLQNAGLVRCEEGDAYRYAPVSDHLDRLTSDLDKLYREKPVLLTRAVVSNPNEKLRLLANAFRIKKD